MPSQILVRPNDDDALELFKKTLPSAGARFMEIKVSPASTTQCALSSLHAIKQSTHRPQLDLIELALQKQIRKRAAQMK